MSVQSNENLFLVTIIDMKGLYHAVKVNGPPGQFFRSGAGEYLV